MNNVENWLEARQLRNRLVHEYMEDAEAFAEDRILAREYSIMLLDTFNRLHNFVAKRMEIARATLPELIDLPGQD